jgi:hypothetical protein
MNDEMLSAVDADPELWLSALADDELDPRQRSELCLWLEQHPAWWRNCAIALLDQQTLRGGLRAAHGNPLVHVNGAAVGSVAGSPAPVVAPVEGVSRNAFRRPVAEGRKPSGPAPSSSVSRMTFLALSACLAAALLAGAGLGALWWQAGQQQLALRGQLQQREADFQRLAGELARELLSGPEPTLAGLYPGHRVLIEIDDSPSRAIYLTDQPVSGTLLESFVAAGHDVDVQPYASRFQTEPMRELRTPVLAVEVRKSRFHDTSLENLQ